MYIHTLHTRSYIAKEIIYIPQLFPLNVPDNRISDRLTHPQIESIEDKFHRNVDTIADLIVICVVKMLRL